MKGASTATMAWRNLWRNRRRTFITLFGISFGVFLAIMFTGIGDSTYGDMIDTAAEMGSGHVAIQHPDLIDDPSLKNTIPHAESIAQKVSASPGVKNTTIRILGQTMVATASQSYGAMFFAIDPKTESPETLSFLDGELEGEMLQNSKDNGIVIGAKLAENLDAQLGSKIVYTMTDKTGEIVSGLARVKGLLKTGSPSMDGAICIFAIDNARSLLGYASGEATRISVFIKDQRDSEKIAASLLPAAKASNATAVSWKKISPDLDGFITMKVVSTQFFEYIIMILVAAGIFNTILVSVMERMREFGIMSAIGFTPGTLFSLVMWESLFLGICGLLAAGIITAWPYYYMSTTGLDLSEMYGQNTEVAGVGMAPFLYVRIYLENALIIAGTAIVATLVSGLYPAWKAGRVAPVETIKLV